MYRKLALAVLCAITMHMAAAQTTTVSGGNWSDASNWSNGVPATGTTTTVTAPLILDTDLTISGSYTFSQSVTDVTGGSNHNLTLTGTLDVTAGTTTFGGNGNINNGSTLIVRNGATLILGNTSVGNGVTLLVEAGGTLIINGSLTNGNNSGTFTIGGMVYVNGNFNNGGNAALVGTGDIVTTNALNNTGSSLTFGTGNDCSTGPCSGRNLCSFSNSITANQTLCSGGAPTALIGNAVGSPTYVWESSTTSSISGFAVAAGTTTNQNYSPSSITQTTWYRRKVTAGGCTGISVPVQITVLPTAGGWRGTTSDWNTASNWCNNTVPTASTDVTISTGVTNMPQMTATSNAHNLTINSGATVTVNGTNTFNIFGNLFNNGTFNTSNSTVVFSGSTQQTVSGNAMNFYNLTVNKSGSTPNLYVNSFLTIQNNFDMTAGVINLSGYNLTLGTNAGSTGTLNYTDGWMDNGGFTRWVSTPSIPNGDTRGLFPMGGSSDKRRLFVSFPTTNPTSMGTIKVNHVDATTTSTVSVVDGASTIVRRNDSYWTIGTGNGLAGGTYNIRAGGTGFGTVGALTDLRLMRSAAVVGTNGGTVGGSTVTDFLVARTGLTVTELASSFYVGSINPAQTPLPVELISFTGQNTDEGVLLKWSTSMEKNFDHFEIERSEDGVSFDYVSSVKGKGGIAVKTDYLLVDGTARNGKFYYRLKNIDLDDTFDYSKVIVVLAFGDDGVIALYPNPVRDKKLSVVIPQQYSAARILISDQMGNPVFQKDLEQGEQDIQLTESLKQGFYIARIMAPGNAPKVVKLWIE